MNFGMATQRILSQHIAEIFSRIKYQFKTSSATRSKKCWILQTANSVTLIVWYALFGIFFKLLSPNHSIAHSPGDVSNLRRLAAKPQKTLQLLSKAEWHSLWWVNWSRCAHLCIQTSHVTNYVPRATKNVIMFCWKMQDQMLAQKSKRDVVLQDWTVWWKNSTTTLSRHLKYAGMCIANRDTPPTLTQ